MDKYEYRLRLARIEELVDIKDYVTAAQIADRIDWRKVKSVKTLTMIADIYDALERPEDCYEILIMIYDRSPIARSVIYRLAVNALKRRDFEEAISFYKEFVEIAPHDPNKYILRYRIYRERGSSVTDQIMILQEYKSHEYDERWAYELACLYEEAGMISQCISECDELILWFSGGEYVIKALELKMKYQELTAAQENIYEHRFETHEEDLFYEQELPAETEAAAKAAEPVEEPEQEPESEATEEPESEPEPAEDMEKEAEVQPEEEILTIPVVNTGKFSTINLQKELAKGLQFVLSEIERESAQEEEAEETEEAVPQEPVVPEEAVPEEKTEKPEETDSEERELQRELMKYVSTEHPLTMEEMLCVEEDGQFSLKIGEDDSRQKQITGQMSIEEILEAWEEKKRQIEAQIEKAGEQKTAILCETGEITHLLEDFIPRTPKEVREEVPEEEAAVEEVWTEEPQEEEFEDDLPAEIDFEDDIPEIREETKAEEKKVTSDTASMIDAIERALAFETVPTETLGRYLTDEEEKIFAYFTSVNGMKKQLVKLLGEDFCYAGRTDSLEGNLVITGHPGNGKTTLAIDIVKAFQKQRHVKGGKLAKVSADGLNKKEPEEVIRKLGGGAMIIERAGALNHETVVKLSAAMEEETGGLLVILEDSKAEVNRLLKSNAGFASKFNRSIDIPIFSNDELVAFGKSYAEEQEYYFDEMAVLALSANIGVRQTSDHVVNITEVKELVDDAIVHAERKSRGLFVRLSKKRIDEYGNKLLLEEDFEC